MAGFDRYHNVLRLFSEEKSAWTVPEIAETLGTTTSTTYRTVRELVAAGFMESAAEAHYRLGPAFLEFDHLIRVSDPLVRSGAVFLDAVIDQVGLPCRAVLARLYGDQVMCVADASTPRLVLKTSYERGRPMPILRGATSKAILSGLTARRRQRLYGAVGLLDADARQSLDAELARVRKTGICVTFSEVDAGAVGVAVPVRNRPLGIEASLSCILAADQFDEARLPRLFSTLTSNAQLIENFMDDAYGDVLRQGHPPAAETG